MNEVRNFRSFESWVFKRSLKYLWLSVIFPLLLYVHTCLKPYISCDASILIPHRVLEHKGDKEWKCVELQWIILTLWKDQLKHHNVVIVLVIVRFLSVLILTDLDKLLLCDGVVWVVSIQILLLLCQGNCFWLFLHNSFVSSSRLWLIWLIFILRLRLLQWFVSWMSNR